MREPAPLCVTKTGRHPRRDFHAARAGYLHDPRIVNDFRQLSPMFERRADLVELHSAHGYLLHQFLHRFNHRTDIGTAAA